MRGAWHFGLGVAWLAVAAGAHAQDEPADDDAYRELPTIYVTAQKVRETLQDVPASVSTIDGDLIRDSGAAGLEELQNYAANVTLALNPASSDFYIRGFGTAGTNVGFEPSVAAIVDGVYYGRSNFTSAVFYDLDRIEVLRGPQGTLFGKNSSAGVLNIVSVAPGPYFFTSADLLVDSTGQRSIEPVVNVPLGDEVSVRFSGAFADDRGRLTNTALDRHENGVKQATGRVRVRWDPAEAWSLDLGGFLSRQSLNNNLFQLSEVGPNMLALMRTYDPDAEGDATNFRSSSNVDAKAVVTFRGAHATFEHAANGLLGIDNLRFTSVTAYARTVMKRRDFDADFGPVPVVVDTLAEPSPYRQISEELRFDGSHDSLFGLGGTFKFVIGGYYFDSRITSSDLFALQDLGATLSYLVATQADGRGDATLPGGIFGGALGGGGTLTQLINAIEPLLGPAIGSEQSALVKLSQRTDTNAAFGQAEWCVWRDVWFIGGVRVGREHKKGHATSQTDSRIIPLIAGQNNHDTRLKRSEREVSPKAGLKWQPNEALNTYVTWSQGFKSGGFNALPLNDENLEFEPEEATNVEGGVKARLLGGSVSVTAAIYSTDFKDLQVSTFRGGNFIILNAARARSRGAEIDVRWLPPVDGTALIASLGIIRAHYTSYPNAPAPADSNANPPVQDLTGERLAITPRYSATLIPSYTLATPFLGGPTTFALDYVYRSGRYTDVDLDPRTYQPATHEINARVTFADEQARWRVTLGARNLTDEVVREQVLDEPLAPGNFGATRSDRGRFYSLVVTLAYPAP